MIDREKGAQLVFRVWGSFLAGLVIVALLAGGVEVVIADGIPPPLLIWGVFLMGSLFALPFLVIASLAAFVLTARIARHAPLWSGAATVIVSIISFLALPNEVWIAPLMVSVVSSIVFCVWLARRPLATA